MSELLVNRSNEGEYRRKREKVKVKSRKNILLIGRKVDG